MLKNSINCLGFLLVLAIAFLSTSPAHAHFLWLKPSHSDTEALAIVSFGESPSEEDYKLPEAVDSTELWWRGKNGKKQDLSASRIETDERVVLEAPLPSGDSRVLEATCTYGIYHTTLLKYFVKSIDSRSDKELGSFGPSKELELDLVPRQTAKGLEVLVLWNGKSLPKAALKLNDSAKREQTATTNQQGLVTFDTPSRGLVYVLGSHVEEDSPGDLDGAKYKNVSNYATLTFVSDAETSAKSATAKQEKRNIESGKLPPLPEPVASFGAAVLEGWLYVYSGHTGGAHEHSRENLVKKFRRVNLKGGQEWQELSMETPLQGFPLVAHGKSLYRIGGMDARNAAEEDDDLHSVADFARFDPETNKWKSLAPLPQPSSSHDAVVVGDKIYVAGGWQLDGGDEGAWHDTSIVYDLSNPNAGWQELLTQPFERRALATSHWQGKLAVLGGIDSDGEVSRRVDFYDPTSGKWSQGPELPGEGTSGFGISAWNLDGELYQSGLDGIVYRLTQDGKSWQPGGELEKARFFHRLLPAAPGKLLAVAGASFQTGHLADIETVVLSSTPTKQDNKVSLVPAPKTIAKAP